MNIFPDIARRVKDRHGSQYNEDNFEEIIEPMLGTLKPSKFKNPGRSHKELSDGLKRLYRKILLFFNEVCNVHLRKLSQRPYWLPGLNEVNKCVLMGLGGWITEKEFQIYQQLENEKVILSISRPDSLKSAFAADCNRMSSAAFESIENITPSENLPRSVAWLIIRSYYSAFFAAHAILRMVGISCTQFRISSSDLSE